MLCADGLKSASGDRVGRVLADSTQIQPVVAHHSTCGGGFYNSRCGLQSAVSSNEPQ